MKNEYFLKRSFDFLLSLAGIIVSLPLWLVIAIFIMIDDGLPVFYRQRRVGIHGREFTTYKFRTMVKNSDTEFGPLQASELDRRVLRSGKLLRHTAMDELPQLLNILKGDMSFVGPRALLPSEIEIGTGRNVPVRSIPGFEKRNAVRPGLTGLAQIYARRDLPRRQKFKYDLLYIKNMGLLLDLKLILLSFLISFRASWEKRGRKF